MGKLLKNIPRAEQAQVGWGGKLRHDRIGEQGGAQATEFWAGM